MRAVADDQQAALVQGISVRRIFALAWALAARQRAVGGVLLANLIGGRPEIAAFGLLVFPVVILGGLDSVPGTVVGGAIIGLLESSTPAATSAGGLHEVIPYVVLVLILLVQAVRAVRPGPDRAGLTWRTATGVYHTHLPRRTAPCGTRGPSTSAWCSCVAAVLALPFLARPLLAEHRQPRSASPSIGAIGLNILVGFTGQISLGQGGFLAVGAYTAALLAARAGAARPAGRLAAVAGHAAVGAFFGLPALRLKGLYLAIATLAGAGDHPLRGPPLGRGSPAGRGVRRRRRPDLFGWRMPASDFEFLVLDHRSASPVWRCSPRATCSAPALGRAFIAIRDQDIAASAIGVDLDPLQDCSRSPSRRASSGLAGALTAHYTADRHLGAVHASTSRSSTWR